ncbi:hypothetical protein [Rhodoferax ferrireducens]|uniref:hypothetical protein n=1 Tax=Rhodoferax ferrireducens TaxID=192843 RepID=UPI000E0DD280|nr:hypothetical protein [Rhodoferax ferrireducens]
MNNYRHHVSGFFADLDDAESAYFTLVERGLPRNRLQIFETNPTGHGAMTKVSWYSALLHDKIESRQIVLVVDNRTEQDTAIAREVIQACVGDY